MPNKNTKKEDSFISIFLKPGGLMMGKDHKTYQKRTINCPVFIIWRLSCENAIYIVCTNCISYNILF